LAVVRVSGAGLGILLLRNREVVLCPIRSVDEVAGVLDGEMDCAIGRQDALAAVLAVFVWLVRIDDAVLGAAVVGVEDLEKQAKRKQGFGVEHIRILVLNAAWRVSCCSLYCIALSAAHSLER